MNLKQIKDILQSGSKIKGVKCTSEFFDDSPDEGMMFDIIGFVDRIDGVDLRLDFGAYLEQNKVIAQASFYDKNGQARLTWFESNFYPENGILTLWMGEDEEIIDEEIKRSFDFSGIGNSLFREYLDNRGDQSYIEWLENELTMARGGL